jgi:hypothetical protein
MIFVPLSLDAITKLSSPIPDQAIDLNVKLLTPTNSDFLLLNKVFYTHSPLKLAMSVENPFHQLLLKLPFVKNLEFQSASSQTQDNAQW